MLFILNTTESTKSDEVGETSLTELIVWTFVALMLAFWAIVILKTYISRGAKPDLRIYQLQNQQTRV